MNHDNGAETNAMIDGYTLVKTIAAGKSGEAHVVRSDTSSQLLYLKTVRSTGRIDAQKRFYRETSIVASFEHPNILRPLDVRFENDALYCIYPYVNGTTLHELLGEQGRIGEADALSMMKLLLGALSYIHARGIIHADVNPSNIIISNDKGLRLFDFDSSLTEEEAEYIEEGVTTGTFPYLSPEQMGCARFKIDTRTDLYCVAMILYRCLAGSLPFPLQNESMKELLDASIRREVPGIKHIPQFVNEILLKGLRPSPIDRYQTADGMLHDISIAAEKIKSADNTKFTVGGMDTVLAVNRKRLFVVREKELAMLSKGLQVFEGNRMVSYLICGKSGIGKTELIREFKRSIDLSGIDFLEAKSNRFSTSQPGSIYRQVVIEFLHGISKTDQEEKKRIREQINRELHDYSGIIVRILPEMHKWFDSIVEVQKVEREKEKDRFIHVLTRVLATICSLRRCVIHLDDLQWIDRITVEVMFRILEQKIPCFFICSYRTTGENDHVFCHGNDLASVGFDRILTIREFEKSETDEFIGRKFKTLDNSGLLVEALYEKTDGIPYLLNEAVRYLVNNGQLTLKENRWVFDIENIDSLPRKFDAVSLTLQKMNGLAREERTMLQCASLIEGKFDCALIEFLTGTGYHCSHEIFASFEKNGFILSHLTGGYAFIHDRIQESIANDLSREERFTVYDKLGTYFAEKAESDKEKLFDAAEYFLKSRNAVKAMCVCYEAALYAMEKNAYDIAIRYFRNITMLADADDTLRQSAGIDLMQVNVLLGDVLMLTGANEQALDVYARIITARQLKNRDKLEIEYKIGSIYHHVGEFELSSKYFMQSLATMGIRVPKSRIHLCILIPVEMLLQIISGTGLFRLFGKRSNPTSLIIVRILNKLAYSLYFNDMVKAYYVHFKALNLADRLIDSAERAESYSFHQICVFQIYMKRRARRYLKKATRIAAKIRRVDVRAFAESFGGLVRYCNAHWRESERLLNNSIDVFRSIGDVNNQIISSEHLWKIAFLIKPFKNSVEQMNRTIDLCKRVNDKYFT
ncbi:MAG: protein kinase, partial [Chitinispirillaceae bacterium]|nr:protein kinase [Chitinispirillaceae bacterium]